MISSPRRPSSTIRILSLAEQCRHVARRISLTASCAELAGTISLCLIVAPWRYDGPESLPSPDHPIRPGHADGEQGETKAQPHSAIDDSGRQAMALFVQEGDHHRFRGPSSFNCSARDKARAARAMNARGLFCQQPAMALVHGWPIVDTAAPLQLFRAPAPERLTLASLRQGRRFSSASRPFFLACRFGRAIVFADIRLSMTTKRAKASMSRFDPHQATRSLRFRSRRSAATHNIFVATQQAIRLVMFS